ncbi:MAG: hypothetical protein IKX88_14420 [Thermoguttaceae bacterium]|nr:hypothetical protein [Thermoguttaceae bacterium]
MRQNIITVLLCVSVLGFNAHKIMGAPASDHGSQPPDFGAPPPDFDGAPPDFGTPPPDGGFMGTPPGGRNRTVEYSGAREIKETVSEENGVYSSDEAPQVAVLVSGGESKFTKPTVTKSGAPNGRSDDYDFYGVNAAVLVYDRGKLDIVGGSITTDSAYSSGLFVYGSGEATIQDAVIKTNEHNSGGIMVTGGGTLTARNLNVVTEGGSSAPIRSDRGGGKLVVEGGTFQANGPGSPTIYSTADITVTDANLFATKSEGAIIEGKNSIALKNVKLVDDNSALHGKSTTRKNIFIYQSFSGDAEVGKSNFVAENCEITTKKGDSIYVTNTSCDITLRGNTFVNEDPEGYFFRARRESWGRKGSNGGKANLLLEKQRVEGNIFVDNISELTLTLTKETNYVGAINAANTGKRVDLKLDKSSTLELTADSYVTSLDNEDSTGKNIILNGYRLHVGETPVEDGIVDTASDDSEMRMGPPGGMRRERPGEMRGGRPRPGEFNGNDDNGGRTTPRDRSGRGGEGRG